MVITTGGHPAGIGVHLGQLSNSQCSGPPSATPLRHRGRNLDPYYTIGTGRRELPAAAANGGHDPYTSPLDRGTQSHRFGKTPQTVPTPGAGSPRRSSACRERTTTSAGVGVAGTFYSLSRGVSACHVSRACLRVADKSSVIKGFNVSPCVAVWHSETKPERHFSVSGDSQPVALRGLLQYGVCFSLKGGGLALNTCLIPIRIGRRDG